MNVRELDSTLAYPYLFLIDKLHLRIYKTPTIIINLLGSKL